MKAKRLTAEQKQERRWWNNTGRLVAKAKRTRKALVRKLGGKCAICGGHERLEIDHLDGRDWSPRGMSSHTRAARYWREFEAGVRLRVLCRTCNAGYRPAPSVAPALELAA